MSTHNMDTVTARIGKFKGEILKHVVPQEVIGRVGISSKKSIPAKSSETISFRRWLPKGATTSSPNTWSVDPATHRLTEGETPGAEQISAQDIEVSVVEYGVLYRYSNRVADLYEDDVPSEMKRLTGERMGLLLEMIRWGVLKAGTNKFYASGVASRSLVTALLSANGLRNIARSLANNLAMKVTGILDGSPKIGTQPVEAAYIVVLHGDLEADLRSQLTNFIHISEYGQRKPIHPNEIGSWESFRFIASPHTGPFLQAGTTGSANTRLSNGVANSAGSELVDVYPILVMTEECYGDVVVRGKDSISPTHIPAGEKTKDDPHGQRGYVGAKTYFTAVRLNEGHMAIYEVACSYLA